MTGERVLRLNALADAVLGVFFLLAPWHTLYDAVDLPTPQPEIYTQSLGVTLLAFAYVLWLAPREDAMARGVSAAAVIGHVGGAALVLGWLLFGDLDVGTQGTIELVVVTVIGLALAAQEARIASGRLAFVLPQD